MKGSLRPLTKRNRLRKVTTRLQFSSALLNAIAVTSSFNKREKLSSTKATEFLFNNGNSFTEFPFRIIHSLYEIESEYPVQVLITVPKKRFNKAVDRNRIKRQISAAYRLSKSELYKNISKLNQTLTIAIVYTSSKQESYDKICSKIILSLQRLAKAYEQKNELDFDTNN